MDWCPGMPLPFDLPSCSRGYAALNPGARATGREVAWPLRRRSVSSSASR
jgi:hypothetical protein